jgi:predicted O-methyltransferase YrrM
MCQVDTPCADLDRLRSAASHLRFAMSCDDTTGRLLATLAASKPGGRLLELGTGVGTGTCWIRHGMNPDAQLTTIEADDAWQSAARAIVGEAQITYIVDDAGHWLTTYAGQPFDLVFADTWPGKFTHLDRALDLVTPGGIYLVDDLNPLDAWPAAHTAAVTELTRILFSRPDYHCTRIHEGSGLLIAVKEAV